MALIRSKDAGFATFDTAYTRIVGFRWNLREGRVTVRTATYADKNSRLLSKQPLSQDRHIVEINHEGMTLASLYTALKNNKEFLSAVDDL